MSKIILGNILRHLVTLLIGFFVARQMLAVDVAQKLYAGDTVELWAGGWSISIKQVVDFLILSALPVLAPIGIGIWVRIKERYKLIVARLNPQTMTYAEVKEVTDQQSASTIVKTVAKQP